MKFAAIDVGTNAARVLIGEVISNKNSLMIKKISYTRIPLRLGMDVFSKGKISGTKIKSFVKCMKAFRLIAETFQVVEIKAYSTSAMREAKNGLEVQQILKEKAKVDLEIISGKKEAELIFLAYLNTINLQEPCVVIDVGGGSTEISIFFQGKRQSSKSFKIGTIRLLKKTVKDDIWDDIHDFLTKNIEKNSTYKVLGSGGNINRVHKMLGKKSKECVKIEELISLYDDLSSLPVRERITKYKLKEDRADVIVPACFIFLTIARTINCQGIFVPKVGLADGMIYAMYQQY